MAKITITFDAVDPSTLAQFWATAMGYELEPERTPPRDDLRAVIDPAGFGPRLLFLQVPEAKTVKNRLHLDIHAPIAHDAPKPERLASIRAVVEQLVAAGATECASFDEESVWTVLTDPEGNEFCVV